MIIPKRLIFQDESYFHDNRLPSGLEPLNLFPTGLNAHYQTRHVKSLSYRPRPSRSRKMPSIFRAHAPLFLNSVLNTKSNRQIYAIRRECKKEKKELRFVYKDKSTRGGGHYSHRVENVSAAQTGNIK